MIISKSIDKYLINHEASINDALKKINLSKAQIVFVEDNSKKIIGTLTDGDIRRWLLKNIKPDLNISLKNVVKKEFVSFFFEGDFSNLKLLFNSRIRTIPLLNKRNQLIGVAESKSNEVEIGGKVISEDNPAFIIAEVGNNHQGSLKTAKKLIDEAVEAGADCVKFQMRTMSSLYDNTSSKNINADLGDQYTLELLSKFQLSDKNLFKAFEYCKKKKIIPLCTPWDRESLEKLVNDGMEAYKVASADLTNYDLLDL